MLRLGEIKNDESLVRGCSFNDGYNTGIGVYGTHGLRVERNVIYHGVNELVQMEGDKHVFNHNLVAMAFAEATFKVWHFSNLIRPTEDPATIRIYL